MNKKITLGIEGMSCSACSNTIEHYLNKQKGVIAASVNLVMANATIEFDDALLKQKDLENFIKQAGYKSTGLFVLKDDKKEIQKRKVALICFSVLAFVLLYFSMGHMIGLPIPSAMAGPVAFSSICMGLTLPFLVYGFDIFIRGIKSLFKKAPNMDTLVTLSVMFSLGYSLFAFIMILLGHESYMHQLYFESAAIIVYFIKLGKFLENASKDKTKSAIKELVKITPEFAFVLKDGTPHKVTLDLVNKGDILVCRPGEKIAVDGTIKSGKAHFDETFITGESQPRLKGEGEKVVAGAINYDGYIEYTAEDIGPQSTISKIVNMVVEATNTKMEVSKTVDKVSAVFTPVLMVIAALTFVGYLVFRQPVSTAIITAVTILVVACPCSLGLGTPLAIVISEGICAKRGLVIKKSQVLEEVNKIDCVVFDKTGTLTYGKPKIAKIDNFSDLSDENLIEIAYSLEKSSTHPIASAFVSLAEEKGMTAQEVEDFVNVAGRGIAANIDKKHYIIGNIAFLEENGIQNIKQGSGLTTEIFLACDKVLLARFEISDITRENAKTVIEKLKMDKIKVVLLSGDNQTVSDRVAKELGIDTVIANVLPSDKAEHIKKLKSQGYHVMMVGDGINDSPSLATADLGVSLYSGTDIAMNSADVILLNDNLESINVLRLVGKKTLRNIKENLFWSFIYNGLMVPVAMGVFRPLGFVLSPMLAALAMVLSSLSVVLNALRLYGLGGNKNGKTNGNQN